MTTEFGWWSRDPDGRRFQIRATIFGGRISWTRKQGHHQPWEPYGPVTDENWERLISETDNRVQRRLLSPKQAEALRRLRPT